jgi:hypothetical protein
LRQHSSSPIPNYHQVTFHGLPHEPNPGTASREAKLPVGRGKPVMPESAGIIAREHAASLISVFPRLHCTERSLSRMKNFGIFSHASMKKVKPRTFPHPPSDIFRIILWDYGVSESINCWLSNLPWVKIEFSKNKWGVK